MQNESSGVAAAEPLKELPLKGYYGGKPTRISIEYDDHSSRNIGNADGSVDLIVANLQNSTEQPDDSPELLALIERVKWLIDDGVRYQGSFSDMATHSKAQADRARLADYLNGTRLNKREIVDDAELARLQKIDWCVKENRIDLTSKEWRPMYTAPKDAVILVLWDNEVMPAKYLDNSDKDKPWEGWKPVGMQPWPAGSPDCWQPMPKPPLSKIEDEAAK